MGASFSNRVNAPRRCVYPVSRYNIPRLYGVPGITLSTFSVSQFY